MSASILRNLVSSVFKVPAHKIVLSGELHPDKTWHYTSNVAYVTREENPTMVWGFNPENGFEEISDLVVGNTHYFNGNHDRTYSPAEASLAEASLGKGYIFFVVNESGLYEDGSKYDNWTIFKAPNFAAHWAAIEEADVKRWEKWLQS